MQLRVEQLEKQLAHQHLPVYLVAGDELFLHQHAHDNILNHYKQLGFLEKQVYHIDKTFDWSVFHQAYNSLSLFAEKQMIELRFTKAGLEKKAAQALHDVFSHLNLDICVLISMPKLSAAHKRSNWFNLIDQIGAIIQVWPLNTKQMITWLAAQANAKSLNLSSEACAFICDKNQGNLLAASQEVEKLSLQFSNEQSLTLADIESLLSINSIYSVFDLSNAFLLRDKKKVSQQINTLKEEGEEPAFILWALLRDLRLLAQCMLTLEQGKHINTVLNNRYMPEKQKQSLLTACNTFKLEQVKKFFYIALEIETAIKGLSKKNAWLLLERLMLS